MNNTVFITGASGYVGRNLQEFLHNKYLIIAPTHKQLDLLDGKVVEAFFKKYRIHTVIHAAVVGGSRKEEDVPQSLEMNCRMLANILRCKRYYRTLIHMGSGAEYDKSRPLVRVTENDFDTHVPRDSYGFYKYLAAKQIECVERAVNLRIFGLFGPGEDFRFRFISNAICRNLFGMPITMGQNVYFDYVSITDLVRIVENFIKHDARHASYNIGTGERIDLMTIANKINAMAECPSQIIVRKKGLNREYTCDNSRLVKELQRFSFTSLDVALRGMYEWYKARKTTIDPSTL